MPTRTATEIFSITEALKGDRISVYIVLARRDGSDDYLVQGVHKTRETADARVEQLKQYDWVRDAYVETNLLFD